MTTDIRPDVMERADLLAEEINSRFVTIIARAALSAYLARHAGEAEMMERMAEALRAIDAAQRQFEADVPNHEPDLVTQAVHAARSVLRDYEAVQLGA